MNGKTFYISIGVATFFLIGGIVLSGALAFGSAWSFLNPPTRLAVVDMQALISKRSQHLAKTNSNKTLGKESKVPSHQIWQAGEQLKETLEDFANKHRLVLFSKGAVMGGNLPDYTAKLLAFIENKVTSQKSTSLRHEALRFEGQEN